MTAVHWETLTARDGDLTCTIYVADVRSIEPDDPLPSNSVDLAVFSPPYKSIDGYTNELMTHVGELVYSALKPGCWSCMNFGQLREEFDRGFRAHSLMCHSGLVNHQRIAWIKSFSPGQGQPCTGHVQPITMRSEILNYSFEDVFTSYKPGAKPVRDRLAVGVPFADLTNLTRGTRGANGNLRCAGDVWCVEDDPDAPAPAWVIPYKTTGHTDKKSHEYEYPAELVRRCIRSAAVKPGSVVFDPFTGAGQTAVVAKSLGCSAVGIERDPARAARALARWKAGSREVASEVVS